MLGFYLHGLQSLKIFFMIHALTAAETFKGIWPQHVSNMLHGSALPSAHVMAHYDTVNDQLHMLNLTPRVLIKTNLALTLGDMASRPTASQHILLHLQPLRPLFSSKYVMRINVMGVKLGKK